MIQNAANPTSAPPHVTFTDRLGTRFEAVSPEGDPVEVLELDEQFASVPSFEFALRKRVNTLTSFRDPSFATIRGLRLGGGLAIVSERIRGTRLSTVLEAYERDLIPIEFNAAICVLRQLVPALAILHETGADICHGALAPERIVITPEGRVAVVEHVLGAALESLRYSDQQYWEDLRIAVPKTAGPSCFDQRSDVLQIGLVALALIHGRSLNLEDYPVPAASLSERAWAATAAGGLEPLPAALRTWLNRILQLEPKQGFNTATGVWAELKTALPPSKPAELQALKSALARYGFDSVPAIPTPAKGTVLAGTPAASELLTPKPAPAPMTPASAAAVTPKPMAAPEPIAYPVMSPTIFAPAPVAHPVTPSPTPRPAAARTIVSPPVAQSPVPPPAKPAYVPAAVTSGAAPSDSGAAPRTVRANVRDVYATEPASAQPPSGSGRPRDESTTVKTPRPNTHSDVDRPYVARHADVGADFSSAEVTPPSEPMTVMLSRQPAGVTTPATDDWAADEPPQTAYKFAIQDEEEQDDMTHKIPWWRRRSVAAAMFVILAAGVGVVGRSFMSSSASAAVPGTLVVETNPPGVPVVLDGKRSGQTPVTLEVAAGSHVLTLLTEPSPRTIPLTVTAGATISQFVDVPKPVAATGQLQIRTEPSGARVVVDGTSRGAAPVMVDNLTPGSHTVEVTNESGAIRQEISIQAGATASLVVPMQTTPQGALSGYISVTAPADVQIYEDVRLIGSSRSDRLMVSVGRHEFDIVNEALGFRTRRVVNVNAGQVSAVKLDWPNGSMALNAQPWAEVFIDGERVGETPIGNVPVPIGQHEVRFRHPELGEQVVRSTVTLGTPARLSVDLRKR